MQQTQRKPETERDIEMIPVSFEANDAIPHAPLPLPKVWWKRLLSGFNSDYISRQPHGEKLKLRHHIQFSLPFIILHLGCLGVLWVGASHVAVGLAFALYWVRMFGLTSFYHRYFSHRSFKTSRFMQFVFAVWGMTCIQRGPLWWASHHRHHHQASDQPDDMHSPIQKGFLQSHIGWITDPDNLITHYDRVKDLCKFPELVWINRYDWVVPSLYGISLLALGYALSIWAPQLHTNAGQIFVWGFFVSTMVLFHGTSTINSLSHVFGSKRYDTGDTSRNNALLAIITMGEGWHNNHHKFKGCVRQGFFWWEIDMSFYLLTVMSWFGLIYDLNPVPQKAYELARQSKSSPPANPVRPVTVSR